MKNTMVISSLFILLLCSCSDKATVHLTGDKLFVGASVHINNDSVGILRSIKYLSNSDNNNSKEGALLTIEVKKGDNEFVIITKEKNKYLGKINCQSENYIDVGSFTQSKE